ncbi:MAG: tRNA uridine-5-carboxymethylaminomethyl(34) synthesis GTPase MnmE [Desulfitobacteriaceae bacterium]|nr:tRNA uridine-5-carboxymethylaminomethyl(34) synthesis GTPase MnmE [Desulfitobacteriaceae bacterium]MDD4345346.1 tRNA uridine-5-carboxymethylaminomethyl(34) synthesis GTPase MnmE [Desulfitobacteriaceae bacterium]MDD4400331.1 tRNA uridine-5-carboxymethylaminomethyl(34) synthesis GTPase MnmE [Desulfitobacteriaceae bacterium]
MDDTIIALATAVGEASIHVIRLSGMGARDIVEKFFRPKNLKRWDSKENFTLHLGIFLDKNNISDQVLVGRMLAPGSYTGEDVYEINCHGGPLITQNILESCLKAGARLAQPGEFSKRAFLNGKMDLIQAEAVVDLISARTNNAAKLAFTQLNGKLSDKISNLRGKLLDILAFIEAGIDFPEDDVEDLDRISLEKNIEDALQSVEKLITDSKTGKILCEGLKTIIVGKPNVGKSSLLNAILKEDRAIVTNIPGTTRDEIRESIIFAGILMQLVDTAGIRASEDLIEQMGIDRTWRALENADLILLVVEAGCPLESDDIRIIQNYGSRVIVVANKIDLLDQPLLIEPLNGEAWIPLSVTYYKGFDCLEQEIKTRVFSGDLNCLNEPLLSNVRQISALEKSGKVLSDASQALENGFPWDIISIDIRKALQYVSEVTGDNVQEDLLETIFSRFCIGK